MENEHMINRTKSEFCNRHSNKCHCVCSLDIKRDYILQCMHGSELRLIWESWEELGSQNKPTASKQNKFDFVSFFIVLLRNSTMTWMTNHLMSLIRKLVIVNYELNKMWHFVKSFFRNNGLHHETSFYILLSFSGVNGQRNEVIYNYHCLINNSA